MARLKERRARVQARRKGQPAAKRELDPVKQAGPKNIEGAHEALVTLGGEATAAQITAQMGSEPGHQVWAIRALVAQGRIEETGVRVNRSMTYRIKRGRTRRAPGSGSRS